MKANFSESLLAVASAVAAAVHLVMVGEEEAPSAPVAAADDGAAAPAPPDLGELAPGALLIQHIDMARERDARTRPRTKAIVGGVGLRWLERINHVSYKT